MNRPALFVALKALILPMLAVALLVTPLAAQTVPQSVKLQGFLTDRTGGTPVPANGTYSMLFEIYDVQMGGTALATVGPVSVTVTDGVYEASIPATASLFDGATRYLQITVEGEVLDPRLAIASTPYSLRSESAGSAESVAPGSIGSAEIADDAVTASKIGVPCADNQILMRSGGVWMCASLPAAPEICQDGSFLTCYTGPPGTLGVGICQSGVSNCLPNHTGFASCSGDVVPAAETCDGLDNDCDGSIDEGACGVCGNGVIEGVEECDDGGTTDGDGCSSACMVESGYMCAGQPSVCTSVCGDGVTAGAEERDDGGTTDGDGCSSACMVESGYMCTGQPSVCMPVGCPPGFDDCNMLSGDGCETDITTVTDCGGCGNACDTSNSVGAACTAGSCTYSSCALGYSDCNTSAPDTDGCECATPFCCGNGCATIHSNGLGQNYFDCFPLGTPGSAGTYNLTMAQEARAAWPMAGTDSTATCPGSQAAAFRQTSTMCAVWVYSGSLAGYVHLNAANNSCLCPSGSDPTWN